MDSQTDRKTVTDTVNLGSAYQLPKHVMDKLSSNVPFEGDTFDSLTVICIRMFITHFHDIYFFSKKVLQIFKKLLRAIQVTDLLL